MRYKAQFLVPIQIEFTATTDEEAERIADEMSVRHITKYGDPSYPDLGCHALMEIVDEDQGTFRTVAEV